MSNPAPPTEHTVLLVGGTGRTGGRVLVQLLERGVSVRAIVRSVARLPASVVEHPNLTAIEADLLSLSTEELRCHLEGCDTVISCLGHNLNLKGIFGRPRDLVTRAVSNLARGVEAMRPAAPVRFILMSTVSVNQPAKADTHRGRFERVVLWVLRGVMPPAKDNQRAADFLFDSIGPAGPYVRWVIVRPDTLREGNVTEYALHEHLVSSLFAPKDTNMANVAHFMCELVTDANAWQRWKRKMPVIVNEQAGASQRRHDRGT